MDLLLDSSAFVACNTSDVNKLMWMYSEKPSVFMKYCQYVHQDAIETVETPQKVAETPQKVTETPQKVEETPQKVAETPRKVVETPQKVVETPQKVAETPQKVEETPQKVVETPQKVVETPQKVAETPQKVVETPQKVVETPQKVAETPQNSDLKAKTSKKATVKKITPIDIIISLSKNTTANTDYINNALQQFITKPNFQKVFGIKKTSEVMKGLTENRWNKSLVLFLSFMFDATFIYLNKEVVYDIKEKDKYSSVKVEI
jgi:hypothetical protein